MPALLNRLARLLKITAVAGGAIAVVRALRGGSTEPVTGNAQWQPLADAPVVKPRKGPVTFTATNETAQTWVEPVDGVCPATHPVKGNADSGIFHVVGGGSYDRTVPERCYATAEDAEADGFRQAKR